MKDYQRVFGYQLISKRFINHSTSSRFLTRAYAVAMGDSLIGSLLPLRANSSATQVICPLLTEEDLLKFQYDLILVLGHIAGAGQSSSQIKCL